MVSGEEGAEMIGIHGGRKKPMTVKRLAQLVGIGCAAVAALAFLFFLVSAPPSDLVIIFPSDALSEHGGQLKLVNIMGIDPSCQAGYGCNDVPIPCSVPCMVSDRSGMRDEAHVVLFHPDYLDNMGKYKKKLYKHTRQKAQHQLFAVTGHEPVWQRPEVWLDPTVTAVFDFTVHWGLNSDVPVNFYYFDRVHYGHELGEWWRNSSISHFDSLIHQWEHFSAANLDILSREKREREPGTVHDVLKKADDALLSVIVSNCESEVRMEWIRDIISTIPTASYGRCLTNANGDNHRPEVIPKGKSKKDPDWDYTQDLMNQKVEMISRHPFHLAIESTNEEAGWVTEKIYQCFMAGTVPIYWGNSRDVAKVVPKNSYIDATQFNSAYELAVFLRNLMTDKELYMKYHAWRDDPATAELFARLMKDDREHAACRICEYYHNDYRLKGYERPRGRLRYTKDEGWLRL